MESIYYVISWLCHRTCAHCYEDRFRPYYGADLARVTEQARGNFARIVAHFPERLVFRETSADADQTGRVILAGGEVLLEAVRETVLYPAMDLLWRRYAGRVKLVVQTTGDLLTPRLVGELLERHAWCLSVSGIDHFHAGLEEPAAQSALRDKLAAMLEAAGLVYGSDMRAPLEAGPFYHFFGAVPGSWIGRLWPRGRAWTNELSTADMGENFCNRWSGGLGFLDTGLAGSEVSVDPDGNVYPCCLKTKRPLGNLLEQPLERILDACRGNPMYEAISAGRPERMGLARGWTEEVFRARSRVILASGRVYENLCIGCDRYHEELEDPQSR